MWIVLSVALVVASESARSFLQDVFAQGSVLVANHLWLLLGATLLVAFACLWLSTFIKKHPKQPPMVRSGLPFLGPFVQFAKNPIAFTRKCYDSHGGIFTMHMMGRRLTFMIGPGNHDEFFKAKDTAVNSAAVYKFMTPVFGKGVVYDAPPKVFQQQLRFMSGGLRTGRLKTYVPQVVMETKNYFDALPAQGTLDLLKRFSELIILTASRTLMGKEVREQLFTQVADLYHDLDEGINALSFFLPNIPIPSHLKRNRARVELIKLFSRVIDNRRANPSDETRTDILQTFMDVKYRDGRPMTNEEISGMLIALLFAGQHTSSISSTWTTVLLLNHPEKMAKVQAELQSVLGDDELNWDNLNQLNYLHCCVKEAVRMFPPLIFVMRKAMKDIPVNGMVIPKDDWLFASPAASHYVPGAFTNPESFEPERFMAPRNEDTKRPFTYCGFGGGLHACLGEQFAFLQVKSILSTMFREYDFELVKKGVPAPDYTAMVVPPIGPNLVRYTRKAKN